MTRFVLVLLVLGSVRPATAQQTAPTPGHVAAAEQLLAAMDAEGSMRKGMERMLEVQTRQNPLLASMQDIVRDFYARHLSWERLKPEMVALYTGTFTEPEIRELTAFYGTPIGRKLVERTPEIMARSAEVTQRILDAHMPELTQRVRDRLQEDPQAMQQAAEQAPPARQP